MQGFWSYKQAGAKVTLAACSRVQLAISDAVVAIFRCAALKPRSSSGSLTDRA